MRLLAYVVVCKTVIPEESLHELTLPTESTSVPKTAISTTYEHGPDRVWDAGTAILYAQADLGI